MANGRRPAKLPKQQLTILAICRFAEPVAMTSVYPYIPEMIQSFNVPTKKVAFYAGLLSLVFSLSQALVGIAWGTASDVFGRKPMIMIALTFTMISSVMFGFSTSLPMAFITRSLQGLSNGNVGIIRTAVAELVPQKELQPRAFSIMPLVWTVGSIFGPSLGGSLVHPVERFPKLFGKIKLLKDYPFALPNLVISMLFLIGITSGILFLRETLEDKKDRRDYGLLVGSLLTRSCSRRTKPVWHARHSSRDTNGSYTGEEAEPFLDDISAPSSPIHRHKSQTLPNPKKASVSWSQIFNTQSSLNLAVYTFLAMHSVAFDQLLPVFLHHSPVQPISSPGVDLPLKFSGGFDLDSSRIGALFTIYGVFGMVIQFAVFPPMVRKFGVLNCYKVCALTFPIVYVITPYIALIESDRGREGTMLALMLVKGCCSIFAFPCSTILLTNSASSLKVLGTLNGVATSISALGRAAGPALSGAAFTLGVDVGYVIIPWWTLATIAIIGAIPAWWLIEMEGFGGKDDKDSGIEIDTDSAEEEERDRFIEEAMYTDDEGESAIDDMSGQVVDDPIEGMATAVRRSDSRRLSSGQGRTAAMGIDDERNDNLPALVQTVSRGSAGGRSTARGQQRRRDSFSMRRMSSPVGMGPNGVATGQARRYSTDLGTTRSGFGTGGTSWH